MDQRHGWKKKRERRRDTRRHLSDKENAESATYNRTCMTAHADALVTQNAKDNHSFTHSWTKNQHGWILISHYIQLTKSGVGGQGGDGKRLIKNLGRGREAKPAQ